MIKPLHTRRQFLQEAGAGAVVAALGISCATPGSSSRSVKPIRGSWISVWWDDRRHFYWNEACLSPYFADEFVRYVNACSGEARGLMPRPGR